MRQIDSKESEAASPCKFSSQVKPHLLSLLFCVPLPKTQTRNHTMPIGVFFSDKIRIYLLLLCFILCRNIVSAILGELSRERRKCFIEIFNNRPFLNVELFALFFATYCICCISKFIYTGVKIDIGLLSTIFLL